MSQNINNTPQISLEQVNAILTDLSHHIQHAFQQKDFQTAEDYLLKVIEIAPSHTLAWMDLASATLRLKKHDLAYERSLKALALMGDQIDPNAYDGLAEICHETGKTAEQIHYGRLSILSKQHLVKDEPTQAFPQAFPPPYNPHEPLENIISYSLFGNLPRYGETAVLNMQLAKEIYPEWTVRFYVDDTVPKSVIERLSQQGAQIIYVTEQQQQFSGLFWRFLVMDDPSVKRFLIRDADSFLSYRERAAVDDWLNSSFWFHRMHDSYSHTELILAGMWGGCHGVFHQIQHHVEEFITTGRFINQRVIDQHYLRYCIWPTLKHSVLSHDSQHYHPNAVAFPSYQQKTTYEQDTRFHVGANEASSLVKISIAHQPCKTVMLHLKNQQHHSICYYEIHLDYAEVLELQLPVSYADKIQTGEWYIATQPKLDDL